MSKAGWILVVSVVVLLMLGYASTRIASSHRKVQAVAMINALQRLYDVAIVTNQTDTASHDLVPSTVREHLLNRLKAVPQVLPSFVDTRNVYITKQAIPVQSTYLFLAIKASDNFICAITADRQPKALSLEEFDDWPHERL